MWNYGFGWWFFPFWPLVCLLFWAIVVFLFWSRWRKWGKRGHWHKDKSAYELLADRFARGEIDEAEYKQRLDTLRRTT